MDGFLSRRLFELSGTTVTVGSALTAVIIVLGGLLASSLVRRAVRRAFRKREVEVEGTLGAILRLIHYGLLFGTGAVALETVGIDLATLFAAGAIFAVGLGFAMQNIAQNFVSGVILLVERAIKPGDIIEINQVLVRVIDLGIRATLVRSVDDEELIVPNSTIVQSVVKNFTLRDRTYRLRAQVGVTYSSDMKLVAETLQNAITNLPWAVSTREPLVHWRGFGDSSVNFEVSVWVDKPWDRQALLSKLYETMWFALKNADITIAFPQVDVHFDSPVNALVERSAR